MNLPNKLTVLRLILVPFMMFFYLATFIPYGIGKIVAIIIFIAAALTDLLDGKIAREKNLVTNLGKFLDPIADKILTTVTLLLVVADGTLPSPWGVIIISIIVAREFAISALRLIAAKNGTVLAADIWGKAKTMVQMIALPFCLLLAYVYTCGFSVPLWIIIIIKSIAYSTLLTATALTVISGCNYLAKNNSCLMEEDKK